MHIPALEREQVILDYLITNDIATTSFLSELTGTSIATIRRDLNAMSKKGIIKKSYGGAQLVRKTSSNSVVASFTNSDPHFESKEQIARKASEFVSAGDIIYIGVGMTCNLLGRFIKDIKNITVVTANVTSVIELANAPGVSILLMGGNVHVGSNHIETLDECTVDSLNKLYFDKVFFTVDGIDLENGYSISNRSQIPIYNHLIKNSKSIYLLADQYKFNKRTFTNLCDINAISNIVTNASADEKYLDYYKSKGINCYT